MKRHLIFVTAFLSFLSLEGQAQQSISSVAISQPYTDVIAQLGFSESTSVVLNDSINLKLEQPSLAYVNLTSKYGIPYTKTSNFKDWIEYYDPQTDTYFNKRVRVNVQGASSTLFPKRNVSIDFCEDAWLCDSVPDVTFKGWVKQDGFHLKAFYTDWLRGVGIVGYQLFDEVESNLPDEIDRIWKRAGIDGNKKARCYPDGFPCAFYLNGEFYGIYVWQLKKHRRNMNMDKHNPTHIHLDGNLAEDNIWNGTVDWARFDVRNPKGLTTLDGSPYDGDAPQELAEGETKSAIIALSQHCNTLRAMKTAHTSREELRAYISEYFDVESMLNYLIFSTAVNNYDGFSKNWQWLTYDGVKWFVAPYDLDCTFGNFHGGTFVFPPEYSYVDSDHTFTISRRGIATWFWDYYFDELCQRYASLRDAGILDARHISTLLHEWHDRIGTDTYEAEWPVWPKCMCVSQTITSEGWAEYWEWPDYYHVPQWDASTTYHTGDLCRLDNRVWLATGTTTGVQPYVQLGYTDSLERLDAWIARRLELDDDFFGYTPSDLPAIEIAADSPANPTLSIFAIDGTHPTRLSRGIYIIRSNYSEARTIIIK